MQVLQWQPVSANHAKQPPSGSTHPMLASPRARADVPYTPTGPFRNGIPAHDAVNAIHLVHQISGNSFLLSR